MAKFCTVTLGPALAEGHRFSVGEWIMYFNTREEAKAYAEQQATQALVPMMVCEILGKISHKMVWEEKET